MSDRTITRDAAEAALKAKASKVAEQDVQSVLGRVAEAQKKFADVPGRFTKMIGQVKLLFEVIGAYWRGEYRVIPWGSVAIAVAALVYFLSPVDLIPDAIPVIGYVDDATIVAIAIDLIQDDLRNYCKAKGYDPAQYF